MSEYMAITEIIKLCEELRRKMDETQNEEFDLGNQTALKDKGLTWSEAEELQRYRGANAAESAEAYDCIDRNMLLDELRQIEEELHRTYDNAGSQDARNSAYGKWIMLAYCIMKIKEQPRMYPMKWRKNGRKK